MDCITTFRPISPPTCAQHASDMRTWDPLPGSPSFAQLRVSFAVFDVNSDGLADIYVVQSLKIDAYEDCFGGYRAKAGRRGEGQEVGKGIRGVCTRYAHVHVLLTCRGQQECSATAYGATVKARATRAKKKK